MDTLDKIVQVTQPTNAYTMHALTENGNLYALEVNDDGEHFWKLLCGSPIITLKRQQPVEPNDPSGDTIRIG